MSPRSVADSDGGNEHPRFQEAVAGLERATCGEEEAGSTCGEEAGSTRDEEAGSARREGAGAHHAFRSSAATIGCNNAGCEVAMNACPMHPGASKLRCDLEDCGFVIRVGLLLAQS